MGNDTRYDPEVQRHEALQEAASRRETNLRAELTETLLRALATGPDAVYAVQRACGHDLARLKILAGDLRVVSSTGEAADRLIEVNVPDNVIDPHETGSQELLKIVHARLLEDSSIQQAERLELVRLMGRITQRLGQMIGR